MKKMLQIVYQWILWVRDVVVFGQWTKFWDFIKLAHSSSDEASSKRLYGGIIVLSCLASFYLFSAEVFSLKAWTVMAPYWTFLLLSGIGLISISLVEKLAQIIANFKITAIQGRGSGKSTIGE
jgi:FtsH-binding integral membrane protein